MTLLNNRNELEPYYSPEPASTNNYQFRDLKAAVDYLVKIAIDYAFCPLGLIVSDRQVGWLF